MLDEQLIRREYGFLGDMIHLNACSVGVPALRTQQAAGSFMPEYLKMVYDTNHVGFGWLRDRVRRQLAELIGGASRNISFTKNTTEGTVTLAKGYPLGPGDNVVVADLENPSNLFPWVQASRDRGFRLHLVKTDGRGVSTEQYLNQIDDSTRIVAVSMVQAGSGSRIDLARLGRFCRERGIVLAVDAIQGLGRLKMDVEECCVDFLTCGGFKGLAAGFGIGFLYCADWLLPRVEPLLAGDFCTVAELNAPEVYREDFPMDYLDSALRFEGGSSNTPGIWQLHHALSLIQELGREQIEDHVLSLERRLRADLAGCGLDVLPAGEKPSGMVIAWYPKERCSQAEEILKKYKIHMTHHEGYLRLSIALHNTPEQMDAVAAAFREIGKLKG